MEQMQVEEKKMSPANRQWILVLLSVVLLLIVIALTSVVVHRSATTQLRAIKEPTLRERFPGYFRYPEEQTAFEKLDRPSTPVTSFPNVTLSSVSQQCSALLPSPSVPINPAREIEHNACCTTEASYISPQYWVDIGNINRTMAVFEDEVGVEAKQFFRTESCKQTDGCDFCTCSVKTTYVTGVWMTGTEYGVSWFAIDGCCKCLNT
ncbi:uncharacterized protein LOC124255167 [Haliotis rubra]|uniref:uncharacterized protein LOC124255167 n=1 Tax=Haliotis rubra TaxID=36100 RepID=UPI001EE56469|nr:uncharacterized protein LOC124255167 [Haliotis rubra]